MAIVAVSVVSCGMSEEELKAFEAEMQAEADAIAQSSIDDLNADDEVEAAAGYTSKDGHFTIAFPDGVTPEHSSETVQTDIGPSTLEMYMTTRGESQVFMVSFNDYSDVDGFLDLDPMVLLKGGRDGALGSFGITNVEMEEEIEKGGYPGLHFRGNNGNYFVDYEMILVNHRLYQIAVLGQYDYPAAEDISGFMGSFALNDIQEVE